MRRRKAAVAVVAALAVVLGTWAVVRHREATRPEVPDHLDLAEVAKAVPPYGAAGRVHVLAWKVEEDGRPFRVERCLVMKVLDEDDEHGRWCLASLYRHPAAKKPEWHLSSIHISGGKFLPTEEILHAKRFTQRPGNGDIYASLSIQGVSWSFDQEEGWHLLSGRVCERNWVEVTGEKPTRYFRRGRSGWLARLFKPEAATPAPAPP